MVAYTMWEDAGKAGVKLWMPVRIAVMMQAMNLHLENCSRFSQQEFCEFMLTTE